MTDAKFKLLKVGDRVKVKRFSKFYNGKIFTVASIGSQSPSWHPKYGLRMEPEIVTERMLHRCECGCGQESNLALHARYVDLVK